ncbi:hypothetical protein D3C76_1471960 [compost metagenome]
MPRSRAGVDEGECLALQVLQAADATVVTGDDQAVIGAAAGFTGHGHGKRLGISHLLSQHIRERPQVGNIQFARTQGFDHAVVVCGNEGFNWHAQALLKLVKHQLAAFDHRLRVFGRYQADGQDLLGLYG